jgi:hypothetical protein
MALSPTLQSAPSFDILPPELKQEIFSYLDGDNASLFAAIQVSKVFHNCCIGMLWRRSAERRLAKVSTRERRQYYANMIYRWEVDDPVTWESWDWPGKPSWELCDGLSFPLLKDLSISGGFLSPMQLRRCLQAGLHTLRCVQCKLDAAMLQAMATCCMQVQRLVISNPDTRRVTPEQFVTFLQSLPSLRRLELEEIEGKIMNRVLDWEGSSIAQLEDLSLNDCRSSARGVPFRNTFLKHCTGLRKLYMQADGLSAGVLNQLSNYPLLEVLHVEDWLVDDEQLQPRFIGRSPLPSIKDLSICGMVSTIEPLLSSLPPTLVSLDLDITDNSYSILPTISRLSNLIHLKIFFDGYREFSRTDLDLISKLSSLQKCHLDWGGPLPRRYGSESSNDCPWLTDKYFRCWISKLPRLQDLFLALDSATITHSSLESLADSCPSLSKCHLMWEHDLNTWTGLRAPLFPKLEVLHLGKVKDHGYEGSQETIDAMASRDVKVIRSLAPNLKSFFMSHSSVSNYRLNVLPPYEKALKNAFYTGI